MVSQVEVALHTINIYLISDIIDLISSDSLKDKRFKFSDQQILTIMVLKEIKGLSLRGIVKELHSNEAWSSAKASRMSEKEGDCQVFCVNFIFVIF